VNLVKKKILNFGMYLDTQDQGISKELLEHGYREKLSVEVMKKILRPDMDVFDLGANIGFYVIIEAQIVNSVLAVEPVKYNYDLLVKNIKLNKHENVTTNRCAIGDYTGQGKIYTSNRCNWATIVDKNNRTPNYAERWDKFSKGHEIIQMYTLDDFVNKFSIKKIDLIRMDVEGAEVDIIGGGIKTISAMPKDSYLIIEIHSSCIKDKASIEVMLDRIDAAGFKLYSVVTKYKEINVSEIKNTREFLTYKVGCPQVFFKKV